MGSAFLSSFDKTRRYYTVTYYFSSHFVKFILGLKTFLIYAEDPNSTYSLSYIHIFIFIDDIIGHQFKLRLSKAELITNSSRADNRVRWFNGEKNQRF